MPGTAGRTARRSGGSHPTAPPRRAGMAATAVLEARPILNARSSSEGGRHDRCRSDQEVAVSFNGVPRTGEVELGGCWSSCSADDLGLTGTHVGCDTSQWPGRAPCTLTTCVKSCPVLALQVDGSFHHDPSRELAPGVGCTPPAGVLGQTMACSAASAPQAHDHVAPRPAGARSGPRRDGDPSRHPRATTVAARATTTSCGRDGCRRDDARRREPHPPPRAG